MTLDTFLRALNWLEGVVLIYGELMASGRRTGEMVHSVLCSCLGPGKGRFPPTTCLHLPVTPAPRDLMPLGSTGNCTHASLPPPHTHMHVIKIKILN